MKNIENIKDKVKEFIEGEDSFYNYVPFTITTTSGKWKMPSSKEVENYRDFALYVGDCIKSLSNSEEEREVITAIILINGIVACDVTASYFSLPSNSEIIEFMSGHKEERILRITESLNIPKGKEWCEWCDVKDKKRRKVIEHGNMQVTEIYDAYVDESPYYLREVEWNFPIF